MSREILFRGKQANGAGWVQGDRRKVEDKIYILDYDIGNNGVSDAQRLFNIAYEVIPETVGQFTGLTDKNGTKIFEGDIIKTRAGDSACVAIVEWEKEGRFLGFTVSDERKIVYVNREPTVEVIGNIHDNPELLGGDGS